MVYLGEQAYSKEKLQAMVLSNKIPREDEEWKRNFWNFISVWFAESFDFIEIKTSGSTGEPQFVRHKKEYMINSAKSTCQYFNLNKDKKALLCLPLTSVGGIMLLVRALVCEMDLYVQKPTSNPLIANDMLFDFVSVVPFQLNSILKQNKKAVKQIKQWLIGGGAVTTTIRKQLIALDVEAYSSFGMTETISHIALNRIGEGNVYEALDGVTFKQTNENCLIINAPHLGVFDLKTNDIIKWHDAKHFEWLGRKDFAIETGGIKVLPERIELKLSEIINSPFFITSVSDELLNNKVILVVESLSENIRLEDLKPFLSKYEMPKHIYFVEKFVYTHSGKLDRQKTAMSLQ